jgi:hypothetical protein
MLEITGPKVRYCDGMTRRSFLRAGFLGLAGLSLADYLRLKAAAAEQGRPVKDTAVILFYLGGGPSHLDMYDLKPNAPEEFRGEFRPIATRVPGIQICEHLPLHARNMDRMAVVRSVTHSNGGHGMAMHWMLTGYVPPLETSDNLNPSCGSVAARMRGANAARMPAYVCLPDRMGGSNAAYLGSMYNPFAPSGDPNSPDFQVRDLKLTPRVSVNRYQNRQALRQNLDALRRVQDQQGSAAGYNRFEDEAVALVTSDRCVRAFDLNQKDPRLRDRYGRDTLGQSGLLARRLVEAGVTFVTVNTGLGWDTHENNFGILKNTNLPSYDRTIATLVDDLASRGLDKKVLVVAYGEFGRTPRVNGSAGRDHWPGALSVLFAGGGLKMGQVVGETDGRAEYPKTRPLGPQDVLATVYHVLGIDYRHVFYDGSGRPIPVLNEGNPIEELV